MSSGWEGDGDRRAESTVCAVYSALPCWLHQLVVLRRRLHAARSCSLVASTRSHPPLAESGTFGAASRLVARSPEHSLPETWPSAVLYCTVLPLRLTCEGIPSQLPRCFFFLGSFTRGFVFLRLMSRRGSELQAPPTEAVQSRLRMGVSQSDGLYFFFSWRRRRYRSWCRDHRGLEEMSLRLKRACRKGSRQPTCFRRAGEGADSVGFLVISSDCARGTRDLYSTVQYSTVLRLSCLLASRHLHLVGWYTFLE